MQTWQEIKDLFNGAVGDTEAAHSFFSATQAVNWANKALWEMAEHANPLDVELDFTTSTGTALYSVDGGGQGVLGTWRLEIDDLPARATTRGHLQRANRNWRQLSAIPACYYLDEPSADPDTYTIGLWPLPSSDIAAKVYLSIVPAAVSDSTPTFSVQVPVWAAPGVLYSMLADAYMSMGKVGDIKVSKFYRMMFEYVLERLRVRSNSRLPVDRSYGSGPSNKRQKTWRDMIPQTIPEP